jgi:hypothetical protein
MSPNENSPASISGPDNPRVWLLLTCGDDRSYAGNTGYEDDLERVYRYDNFVPNHLKVTEGDLALLRGKQSLLGVARIERITSSPGQKERLRCPECGGTSRLRLEAEADGLRA